MTATILIVDDLESNLKLLEAKLLDEYYIVFKASNGYDALKILEETKIDIIFLDIMMPGMDGFEVCKIIKSNKKTTHIPVVMVTALYDSKDKIKGLEAGADEFLSKPIDDVSLFARVKSLSRTKSIIDELKLRNKISTQLGGNELKETKDDFSDSVITILTDDVIQSKNLKQQLKDITSNVESVSSLKDIDLLPEFAPDLIIISCQIDSEDPLRVAAALRARENFQHVVLMFVAEDENMQIVIKGLELGINDYFLYPVDSSELHARIKTQLRKKEYQDNLRLELEQSFDLSTKDGLTGLFNRRYFDIHLKQVSKKVNECNDDLCMIMIDVDHFKNINDTYGHQAGDYVLRTISDTLKSKLRITDLIARYGGEEFAVLLDANFSDAKKISEKIRIIIESIDFKLPEKRGTIKNTISVGVTIFHHDESVNQFVSRADKALYKAKQSGRNKVISLE